MSQSNAGRELGIVNAPEDLGATIRRARLALGLTPEQAAERCGVTAHTLVQLEHGAWDMNLAEVFSVVNNLGLELVAQPMGKAMLAKILTGDPEEVSSALDEYYGAERPWMFP
jgi:transcriptional regulator with XRE-family HTH domain